MDSMPQIIPKDPSTAPDQDKEVPPATPPPPPMLLASPSVKVPVALVDREENQEEVSAPKEEPVRGKSLFDDSSDKDAYSAMFGSSNRSNTGEQQPTSSHSVSKRSSVSSDPPANDPSPVPSVPQAPQALQGLLIPSAADIVAGASRLKKKDENVSPTVEKLPVTSDPVMETSCEVKEKTQDVAKTFLPKPEDAPNKVLSNNTSLRKPPVKSIFDSDSDDDLMSSFQAQSSTKTPVIEPEVDKMPEVVEKKEPSRPLPSSQTSTLTPRESSLKPPQLKSSSLSVKTKSLFESHSNNSLRKTPVKRVFSTDSDGDLMSSSPAQSSPKTPVLKKAKVLEVDDKVETWEPKAAPQASMPSTDDDDGSDGDLDCQMVEKGSNYETVVIGDIGFSSKAFEHTFMDAQNMENVSVHGYMADIEDDTATDLSIMSSRYDSPASKSSDGSIYGIPSPHQVSNPPVSENHSDENTVAIYKGLPPQTNIGSDNRRVSGCEDNTVAMGTPTQITTFLEYTGIINTVQISPDGILFATAGADGRVIIYDVVEGVKQFELADDKCKRVAHGGSVSSLTWSPDGSRIATSSGDKTVKIWNVAQRSLEKTVKFGTAVEDQQLSVAWPAKGILYAAHPGATYFIDPELGKVTQESHSHTSPLSAISVDASTTTLFTADIQGTIIRWNMSRCESKKVTPQLHKSQIIGLFYTNNGTLISTGWDDTLQFTHDLNANIENARSNSIKLPSQPLGLASSSDGSLVVVSCYKNVTVFQNEKLVFDLPIDYQATCVALLKDKGLVAVGGQNSKIHVYSLTGDGSLTEKKVLTQAGPLTSVAFSDDGKHLIGTDDVGRVVPYGVDEDFATVAAKEWTFHTAKVNCVAWHPNGRFVATGGLDTNIIVWDLQNSREHPIIIKGAHQMSPVNGLAWMTDKQLISAGQDASVKFWTPEI